MAHSWFKIFVPSLGSGVQVPTLPMGAGVSDEAVNICHATNDVTPELAAVAPVASTTPQGGLTFKTSAGAFLRVSAQVGWTSGWLVLIDAIAVPSPGAALVPLEAPLWIESNQTAGFGVLEYRRGLKTNVGCTAVFTINASPLVYTVPPAGSLALFSAQVV